MILTIVATIALSLSVTAANVLEPRQDCSDSFKICDPQGANSATLGPIDASWGKLYQDIINLVDNYDIDDAPTTVAPVNPDGPARREIAFCCQFCHTRS